MPVIAYNINMPDGPNNPSDDQPKMKENTNSIQTIIDVDHYAFGVGNGGWHKQVTFPEQNTPLASTDPSSVIYTDQGTASTKSELQFQNANGVFPVSAVRAFLVFQNINNVAVTTPIVPENQYNVMSVNKLYPAQTIEIIFETNSFSTSIRPVILVSTSNGTGVTYTLAGNTMTITAVGSGLPFVSIAVLQY